MQWDAVKAMDKHTYGIKSDMPYLN